MAKLHKLLVILMVCIIAIDTMVPAEANMGVLQKSWRAMMKRMRQRRQLRLSDLMSVRKLGKRVIAG